MRDFREIRDELALKKFLDSPMGTLYFVPFSPGKPRVIVRHFDNQLPVSLIEPFATLTQACHDWLAQRQPLSRVARMVLPEEVGKDFIAREHFTYYTSIESYEPDEENITTGPPPELTTMRQAFCAASSVTSDALDSIVKTVLARSLLEPTGKTFYDENEGRFIIVEIKPTRKELEKWAQLKKI